LLIVHEDNITCGFGAEVAASVAEAVSGPITIRRLARPDIYIPCNYRNQLEVLPSFKRILSATAEMLGLDLQWDHAGTVEDSTVRYVDAIGSSPADQTVTVLEWKVGPGDFLQVGQSLAEMEADKAVFELASPVSGLLEALLVREDEPVPVGTHLLRVRAGQGDVQPSSAPVNESGKPLLRSRISKRPRKTAPAEVAPHPVGLSRSYTAEGSVEVTNDDLVRFFPERTPEEIFRLTGIRARRRISTSQSLLSLATTAALRALDAERVGPDEIDAIFCSTSTPMGVTPSLACLVRGALAGDDPDREVVAYDLFAACSGYLYGLSAAFDFLQTRPQAKALVVTAEVLSQIVDPADFDTAVLFGDAASATVVYGRGSLDGAWACLERPITTVRTDQDRILSVPSTGTGFLRMQGKKVFSEAVRSMVSVLQRACAKSGLSASDLALLVPHQANGRILEAVRVRLGLPPERLANSVAECGNTSSSSIPLALANAACHLRPGSMVGLCAFGGGFTSGAALLSIQSPSAVSPTPRQSDSSAGEKLASGDRGPASDCLVGNEVAVNHEGARVARS
jgi:2-oxoisovalerate dehydrogenase E1 component